MADAQGRVRNQHDDYARQSSQYFSSQVSQLPAECRKINLLPDEEILAAGDFTESPILRHIKTGLVVTTARVVVRAPQFMLFVVKVGYVESVTPLHAVTEVTIGRILSKNRILLGSALGFSGLFLMFGGGLLVLLGILMVAVAAVMVWMARSLGLVVVHAGGRSLQVNVDGSEFSAMIEASKLIQQLAINSRNVSHSRAPGTSQAGAAVQNPPDSPSIWRA